MTDYYKILGISIDSSSQEIKKAYKKLSLKFHPDKNDGDIFFENMFKQIQEAYEILINEEKRRIYDNELQNIKNNSTKNTKNNFEPIIELFESNKNQFYSGETITFKWKTYNSDLIEIKPFGLINTPIGEKSFKLNNVNKRFLSIQLIARNTNINKVVKKEIKLENKIFKDAIKEKEKRK